MPPARPTTRSPSCWGWAIPGGPWIDALARFGDPQAVPFSFAQIKTKVHLQGKAPRTKAARTAPIADLDPHFLFSFSGIKTAVLRYVELHHMREEAQARIAAHAGDWAARRRRAKMRWRCARSRRST